MPRIKVPIPAHLPFSTIIPIRITDLNYGGHVGNDTLLSLLHEARVQFLKHHGYGELTFAGVGLIMADVAIEFRQELFYGDEVRVFVGVGDFTKVSFDIYYKLQKATTDTESIVAVAKTGMVCYDYDKKKVVPVPDEAKKQLEQ
jgi:acyl-CoA thioester hydrolase